MTNNPYDQLQVSLGHDAIFGWKIGLQEIIAIIAKYPAFQWLDLVAKVESFLLIPRDDVPQPQIFLANNLFPPSTLRRLKNHSADKTLCFTPGQLNFFRKLVIGYGKNDGGETEVPIPLTNISKVLLGVQDLHNSYDKLEDDNFERFCQFAIRNGYLNGWLDFTNSFYRAGTMCTVCARNVPFDHSRSFSEFFIERIGMNAEKVMALSFGLASLFFQKTEQVFWQTTILNPNTYFEKMIIDSKEVESIIQSMAIDFADAQQIILPELSQDPSKVPIGYDLSHFRKSPLIRLDNGKIVCANLSCLLEKATQNIFWFPQSQAKNLSKAEATSLSSYRGALFGEYVKRLCKIMENKNTKLSFFYISGESTADHEEVGDSILVQGDKIVIIEAKSRQFKEEFKSTGDWKKDDQFEKELINKAAKQIQIAADKIRKGRVGPISNFPTNIQRIYPVVITYESVPTHAKIQRFIRQRVRELGYLTDNVFAPLEIIDINDIEVVLDCADSKTLIELLEEKDSEGIHASETNFKNFCAYSLSKAGVICNGWQLDQWTEFSKKICTPNLIFKEGKTSDDSCT